MDKVCQGAKPAVAQHDCLPARPITEWHHDKPVLVCLVLVAREPQGCLRAGLVVLIQHAKLVPGRAGVLEHTQVALADERPAAPAIADKLHHVDAALLEFRKIEISLHPPQRALVIVVSLLASSRQAVEVDGGIHRVQVARIKVERVDLKHTHDQLLHVLHIDLQGNRLACLVEHLVHRREIQIDSLLQRLDL